MIVIDRFEGKYAILETDEGMIHIQKDALPSNAKEGDLLLKKDGRYFVDEEGTKRRIDQIKEKMDRLFRS